jgi:hypothetical protein
MISFLLTPKYMQSYTKARMLLQKIDSNSKNATYSILREINAELVKCCKERKKLLLENKISKTDCINLSTVDVMRKLQKNYVVVIINGIIAPIRIDSGVIISDNFNPIHYSINKVKNSQVIQAASTNDIALYSLIKKYTEFRDEYIKNFKPNPFKFRRRK